MIRVISLGAGVQSTTLALMAAKGEIGPMPDCAIFADTGWEPTRVHQHLAWLVQQLPFPVHTVSLGSSIREDAIAGASPRAGRYGTIPWFTRNADGSKGMGWRQCTTHYKIEPVRRKVREMLGGKTPKGGCEMWMGISTDEAMRMKPSRVQYVVTRYPLIERGMSRRDCLTWMARQGYPTPPKSACVGCPYHSQEQWREIKADPEAWADVIEVDAAIRNQPGKRGQQFMHAQRVPLAEVDLRNKDEREPDLFNNDCEGMCGV